MKNILEWLEMTSATYPNKIAFTDQKKSLTFIEAMEAGKCIGSYLQQFDSHQELMILLDKSWMLADLYLLGQNQADTSTLFYPTYTEMKTDSPYMMKE